MDGETFASYAAKRYIGRKGFKPGTVPEAECIRERALRGVMAQQQLYDK